MPNWRPGDPGAPNSQPGSLRALTNNLGAPNQQPGGQEPPNRQQGALLIDDQGAPGPLTNNQGVLESLTDDQGAPGAFNWRPGSPRVPN